MFCVIAHTYTGACEDHERTPYLLEMELVMVVNHLLVLITEPWSSGRAASDFNCSAVSPGCFQSLMR